MDGANWWKAPSIDHLGDGMFCAIHRFPTHVVDDNLFSSSFNLHYISIKPWAHFWRENYKFGISYHCVAFAKGKGKEEGKEKRRRGKEQEEGKEKRDRRNGTGERRTVLFTARCVCFLPPKFIAPSTVHSSHVQVCLCVSMSVCVCECEWFCVRL